MATDGATPPPCDKEIFEKGQPIVLIDGSSNAVERWVKSVALMANARVDWHYSGGIAQVLHLGDLESRYRVYLAILTLEPNMKGRIVERILTGEPGLYRRGVTEAPEGAIASFMNPLTRKPDYILEDPE